MSISFELRLLPGYLRLDCAGTFTQKSTLDLYTQAFVLAQEHNCDAVLIDARAVTGRLPTIFDRYEQAIHVVGIQQKQEYRVRVALLGHEPMIHPERFGELVATNRGALVKVHTDEDAALDWLLARQKPG